MIVSRVMTKNPVYTRPETRVSEARSLMNKEKISHLPVLDKDNNLVGIATKKDMLKAGPSPATTLDMYEISYLLSKMTVDMIMTKTVICTVENEVIEEAARMMSDNDISCLPVMRDKFLIGIVTVNDLFESFITAFGARHIGVRVSFVMQEKPGQIARLGGAIAEKGGNIVSFVTHEGDYLYERGGTMKITGLDLYVVKNIFEKAQAEILDIRQGDGGTCNSFCINGVLL
ncbi:MAG: CBS and ACT domain-containing protein [Spirochaetaceae bacterium]|jgi:acetoin utilization protein AcuB|nr:CBS and ACT domain-containing protein [Spirochaetaceae bacterium]